MWIIYNIIMTILGASYFVFRKLDVLEKTAAEISEQTGNKV